MHAHGPEGSHSHAGTASTTWLDPEIAVAQATTIHDALVRILPAHQEEFGSNLATPDRVNFRNAVRHSSRP